MNPTGCSVSPRARATLAAALLAVGALACGGSDKPAGPAGGVAAVQVSAPTTTVQVGSFLALSVKYFDAAHTQLSGKAVSYGSSDQSVATVNSVGTVTGVAEGSAIITVTVENAQGSITVHVVPVPVASIAITPAGPAVRQGETTALTAQPEDNVGRPLSGRPVTWSSAIPATATINATTGVVTGVVPGYVYIRAESEGVRDSVRLRVKSLNSPSITGSGPALITPGGAGTVTGVNFGATPNENEILVNGVSATITAASATSVSFTVPAAITLPCTPTGPVPVSVIANADTSTTSMTLQMATQRTLAVGESLLLTSHADLSCNEFNGTGGTYLITAFNYATDAGVKTSFQLVGASSAAATAQQAIAGAQTSVTTLPRAPLDDPMTRHMRAHLAQMQQDRAAARRLGDPHVRARMHRSGPGGAALSVAAAVNPPPSAGDMVTYRMQRTLGNYTTYDNVRFRTVYVGQKIIVFEDSLAPLSHQMDQEYIRMGQEFDQIIWPVLLNFGNPLVVDSALDNNGHLIALFSPRVNHYSIDGVENGLLGFVTLCDYFPRVEQVVNGETIPACPASNEAEAFYAIVPDPAGNGLSATEWRRYMRGTLAHEAKHITSFAERYYREASQLEETWLEEATAQVSSEIWARQMYHVQQSGDAAWNDGPRCDYAPASATCPDPAEGILYHYSFLYDHYDALEAHSILDDPNGPIDPVIYGSSWSFARWVADTYAPDEGTFFRSLVQVQNDRGVQNITSKSRRPFDELLGLWSLASVADDYPGATINDPRLRLPSWNSRDLFDQMSANLRFTNGAQAFPKAWPLASRPVTFGTFSGVQETVNLLRGGAFAAWELTGTQTAPQVLAIRSPSGGLAPPLIGMAIVRVQ